MKNSEIIKLRNMLEDAKIPFLYDEYIDYNDNWLYNNDLVYIAYPALEPSAKVCLIMLENDMLTIDGLFREGDIKQDGDVCCLTAENVFERIIDHYKHINKLKTKSIRLYSGLVAGDTFKYNGYEFMKLKNGKAIINDILATHFFSTPDDTCYENSCIRKYIKTTYLDNLGIKKALQDESVELLTKEEYRENIDMIRIIKQTWWVAGDNADFGKAWYVGRSTLNNGEFIPLNAITDRYGGVERVFAVRPVFNFLPNIEVEVYMEEQNKKERGNGNGKEKESKND